MIDAVLVSSALQRPRLVLGSLANGNGLLEYFGRDFGNVQERS